MTSCLPLGMPKALKRHAWTCGDGEEGGEGSKSDKAETHCAWTVGWDTSTSRLGYKHQRRFYNICVIHILRGVTPRALHSPAKPGQGFRAIGCWTLNSTLNDIVLTC